MEYKIISEKYCDIFVDGVKEIIDLEDLNKVLTYDWFVHQRYFYTRLPGEL